MTLSNNCFASNGTAVNDQRGLLAASQSAGCSHYPVSSGGGAPPGTPQVTLTKSVNKGAARAGDVLTYTIAYQNTGSASAVNFVIQDAVPTGTTLTGSVSNGGSVSAGIITWTIGTIASGASGSVSFQVTVH